jgi:hypothetical protein
MPSEFRTGLLSLPGAPVRSAALRHAPSAAFATLITVQFAMIAGLPYTALRDAVLTHRTLVAVLVCGQSRTALLK